jgi:hypothetical protein
VQGEWSADHAFRDQKHSQSDQDDAGHSFGPLAESFGDQGAEEQVSGGLADNDV